MVLLRTAGLVTMINSGSITYYSLRRDRLDAVTRELNSFLAG
jgi:hypothetical protein